MERIMVTCEKYESKLFGAMEMLKSWDGGVSYYISEVDGVVICILYLLFGMALGAWYW